MACTELSTAHVAGSSCCQPCASRRWEKYPWRCKSVTATMGSLRSAAARTVSPARTPSPPLYVGIPTSSAISIEKYATVLSVSMPVTPCLAERQRVWDDRRWRQRGRGGSLEEHEERKGDHTIPQRRLLLML